MATEKVIAYDTERNILVKIHICLVDVTTDNYYTV